MVELLCICNKYVCLCQSYMQHLRNCPLLDSVASLVHSWEYTCIDTIKQRMVSEGSNDESLNDVGMNRVVLMLISFSMLGFSAYICQPVAPASRNHSCSTVLLNLYLVNPLSASTPLLPCDHAHAPLQLNSCLHHCSLHSLHSFAFLCIPHKTQIQI